MTHLPRVVLATAIAITLPLAHTVLTSGSFASARTQALSPALEGQWRGAIRGPVSSWRVVLRVHWLGGRAVGRVDLPDASAYRRPIEVVRNDSSIQLERTLPNGTKLSFIGTVRGDSLFGTWSGYGHEAPFTLFREHESEDAFRAESVTFRNGAVTLAGTLVLPTRPGRHPALVCIHGSGPVDRTAYESKAIYLAQHGVAALIYDKRGTGHSSGDWQTAGPSDLASDALAGIALLRSRSDIDPRHVGAEGFSQGGWIAPLAAGLSPEVAFVVVGSAAGLTPAEQSVYDVTHRLEAAGFDSIAVRRASALRRRLYQSGRDKLLRQAVAAEFAAAHTELWFPVAELPYPIDSTTPHAGQIALLELEPRHLWEQVRVPVLAYWGDRDPRLPVDSSVGTITGALRVAGNRHVTTRVFTGADHVMTLAAPAAPAPSWDFPRTAPFFELISTWVRQTTGQA
jgi:dienelactone hydrolase